MGVVRGLGDPTLEFFGQKAGCYREGRKRPVRLCTIISPIGGNCGEAGMDDPILSEELKENVQDSSVWKRLLFMLLFGFLYSVAEVVLVAVVIFQFLSVLFTGDKNDKLLSLGGDISTYIYQVLCYLTYNSEERPYPFADWPSGQGTADTEAPIADQGNAGPDVADKSGE